MFGLDVEGRIADAHAGWSGFCRDLFVPLLALVGDRDAVRSFSNPARRLIFEDSSRNHRRRWRDTMGCGNRARVRRARVRHARVGGSTASDVAEPIRTT